MSDKTETKIILASSSPRRRQLLAEAGVKFDVVDPPLPEPDETVARLSPSQQAEALAYFKGRAVADRHPGAIVLAADTVVALGRKVLGKPADDADARAMLATLSGTRHKVITGVAVLAPGGARIIASDLTYVTMRPMTEDEIENYVASGEAAGKAGAYAIQETGDKFVEKIEGSFSNVVGLPMELVQRMLNEILNHPASHRIE